jgi:hypothetical protein
MKCISQWSIEKMEGRIETMATKKKGAKKKAAKKKH